MTNLLTDDEAGYFMEMESLFNHPGWARLCGEMRADVAALPEGAFRHAKTFDDILAARARLEAIEQLLALPASLEVRRAQIEQQRQSQVDDLGDTSL